MTGGVTTTYTYDNNGNTLTVKEGDKAAVQYSYNAANQLTGYTNPAESVTATYTYDPDGLRSGKTVNSVTTTFLWDGDQIAAETGGSAQTTYIRGLQLIAGTGGTTSYYLHDGHGNVTNLTNTSGAVTESYRYDAFGELQNDVTSANPFRYCGEYWDGEAGTYYLRARNYAPYTGRFLARDSHWTIQNMIYGDEEVSENEEGFPVIEAIRQSTNLYVYCMDDPVGYIDIDGELAYPGQIHNLVVDKVSNLYDLYSEQTIIYEKGWGRADLISEDGEVWDVKRAKIKQIEAGILQVEKYTKNKWKGHENVVLRPGGFIETNTFTVNINVGTYKITYKYVEGGIIAYDYERTTNWNQVQEYVQNVVGAAIIAGMIYGTAQTGGALVPAFIL